MLRSPARQDPRHRTKPQPGVGLVIRDHAMRMNDATTERPGDVLVIFGITGDLARVMTFRSLYRLEQRGLLDCPIVGVAGRDWSAARLVDHARDCLVGAGEPLDERVFARLAARFDYVQGDFKEPATY